MPTAGAPMAAALELEAFCQERYRPLIRALTLYCGNAEVARDIAQDALVQVCVHWRKVARMGTPEAWVHRVAMNAANSFFRRRLAEQRALHRVGARQGPSVAPPSEPSASDLVRQAIAGLPPRQREAVILRYLLDLDVSETSRHMECGTREVKKLTAKGLERLRADPRLRGWQEFADGA